MQEVQVPHIQRFATVVQLDVSQNHIYPNKCIIIAFHYVCSSQVLDLQNTGCLLLIGRFWVAIKISRNFHVCHSPLAYFGKATSPRSDLSKELQLLSIDRNRSRAIASSLDLTLANNIKARSTTAITGWVSYPILTNSNCLKNHQLITIYKWQDYNVSKVFCFFLQHYIDLFPWILQPQFYHEAAAGIYFLAHL